MTRKLAFLLAVVASLVLTASSLAAEPGVTVTRNEAIGKSMRTKMRDLNEKLLEAIRDNKPNVALNMGSDLLEKQPDAVRNSFKQLSTLKDITTVKPFNEYHIKLTKDYKEGTPYYTDQEDDPFLIAPMNTKSTEIYVSLLKSSSPIVQYLVGFVYVKEKTAWKLHNFACGDYSFNGKNALSFHNDSLRLDKEGYPLPSFLYIRFAANLFKPAPFLQYKKEEGMGAHLVAAQRKLVGVTSLPKEFTDIKGKPSLWAVSVDTDGSGLVPVFKYRTSIALDKKDDLVAEAQQLMTRLAKLFPGTVETFGKAVMQAYEGIPSDPKTQYKYFNIELTISK